MNENILVGWIRKSKKGDKLVISVNKEALVQCQQSMGRTTLITNTNKIVGLIQDKVEVCAANHIVEKTELVEMKMKYMEE